MAHAEHVVTSDSIEVVPAEQGSHRPPSFLCPAEQGSVQHAARGSLSVAVASDRRVINLVLVSGAVHSQADPEQSAASQVSCVVKVSSEHAPGTSHVWPTSSHVAQLIPQQAACWSACDWPRTDELAWLVNDAVPSSQITSAQVHRGIRKTAFCITHVSSSLSAHRSPVLPHSASSSCWYVP
jgi:hypothetical protein